jgi:hypothetical protein
MSYEVYNDYRRQPRYKEFITEVNRVVNHMRELKNWYNKQFITNDVAYTRFINIRNELLNQIYVLEKKYRFYSDGPFTEGYY